MLKRIPNFLLVLVLLLGLVRCAKKGMPQGGPEDEKPPRFLNASPENFSTNFKRKEIRIYFDEYIKLKNPQQQIIISPPMDPKPTIMPMGSARKDIRIEIFDTLSEHTTYTINFGKSIVDNNEGNELPYFKYVFSTGDFLDSLEISGVVDDAYLKEPTEPVSIFLYEVDTSYSDSSVYKEKPRYVTYSVDSTHTFALENLKEGTYQMVAVLDKNANYYYNPRSEKIGFVAEPITIPTDTSFHLRIFKEDLPFRPVRPKLLKGHQVLIGYEGTIEPDSIRVNLLHAEPPDFASRILKDPKTDTLYYWFNRIPDTDSLNLEVQSPVGRDTLRIRLTEMDRDSLRITTEPGGSLEFGENFRYRGSTPIATYEQGLISILDQDSSEIDFTTQYRPFQNELHLIFEREPSNRYTVTALPGALTDLFGQSNDTISKEVSTRALSEYGNLSLQLQNLDRFPVIIQLTDLKGEVQTEKFSESKHILDFSYLKPGKYLVRVIYDDNENRKWDTGNFLEKRQPETIRYLQDTIQIRANWDINQPFILN